MHSSRCGYCNRTVVDWQRTPQGRPSCPHCGAIPADQQREHPVGDEMVVEA